MGKTVYIVARGIYPDQSIHAVFSKEEDAKAFAAELDKIGTDPIDVTEWALDTRVGERRMAEYIAEIYLDNGEIREFPPATNVLRRPDAPCLVMPPMSVIVRRRSIYVRSPVSQEHANKVAAEQREKYLREGVVDAAVPVELEGQALLEPATTIEVESALLLVLDTEFNPEPFPPITTIMGWTQEERDAVFLWAMSVHDAAGDNDDVVVPPKPAVLVEFQRAHTP